MYEANKKNSSYRKILDGIQRMSSLHSDAISHNDGTASSKVIAKPYKSSALLAQSFYDEGLKMQSA